MLLEPVRFENASFKSIADAGALIAIDTASVVAARIFLIIVQAGYED
jgi:hypothetical protein